VGPNVILIVLDTARADAFEPYGARHGSSPAVGQLARRGQAHEAFSAAPWTVPSHASMFSGLLPETAGIPGPDPENMGERTRDALPALRDRWLPAVLSAAGYQTAGISANVQISEATGFSMGFDQFEYVAPPRCGAMAATSALGQLAFALLAVRARTDDGAADIGHRLDDWIASPRRAPFFWFVNLIECHTPYLPPKPYSPLGPLGRLRAGREAQRHLTQMRLWRAAAGGFDIPQAAVDRMRLLYAASVRQADDWVARLLDRLDHAGLLDETIVIVTADHGENLGEGNLIGHVFSLDDRLIRVPFVVSGPAAPVPGPRFSLLDLPGWIAASCGIADAPWPAPRHREVAVAQFTAPGEPGDPRAEMVAEDWGLGEKTVATLTTSLSCATNGHLKLQRRGGTEELIDTEQDPLELAPRPVGDPEERRYAAALAQLRAALAEADRPEQAPDTPAAPAARWQPSAEETAALEASLRHLGYM
jgi:arylsulfatase A-like enzyme